MKDYLADRESIVESETPGLCAVQRLCVRTDEAVRALARAASSRIDDRWALVALGGWGAGALLPRSDLDILVLSDAPPQRLRPFVEAVLYPLWDAGLKVGHQVRSPKQQVRAMREDLKTCTAMLTGRALAGDADWASAVIRTCRADAAKRSKSVLAELARRERPGSPYLLEPDLKNGMGGRRDYDELIWTAALLGDGEGRLEGLVELGHLSAEEAQRVAQAAESVAAARWELQRDGFGDRMTLEAAAGLASVDPEAVQEALGETSLVLGKLRDRVANPRVSPSRHVTPDAGGVLELLGGGEAALRLLEEHAQSSLLDELLPGFRRLMSCRRPGLGHELTVGAHSLKAASLATLPPADDAVAAGSRAALRDPAVLQVAALTHDAGKQMGGAGHAERGAAFAAEAAARFGLGPSEAQAVGELVRHHLLFVETAMRDDLDDEDTLLRAASKIGDRELIAPLHLLTIADSRATGQGSWTPWTAALLGALVSRVDAALSPEVDGAGLVAQAEAVRHEALATFAEETSVERAFVFSAPLRYLASRNVKEVSRDAALVSELGRVGSAVGARVGVSAGPAEDTYAVTVAALDRPELLARISGALSLAGLDILSVDAYRLGGGVVLDSFVVTSATRRAVDTESFTRFERFLHAALHDRLELATRLAERARHYPPTVRGGGSARVEPMGWATALHVTAPDRPGLLHDIARAVSSSGVDIGWARIQTIDGVATDVFHIVGADGASVTDTGVLGHVSMNVRAILEA